MTTIETNDTATRSPIDFSKPLGLVNDQQERWAQFRDALSFDQAADLIIAAAREDGKREDLGVGDLSTWCFGPTVDGHASITPVPVKGRPTPLVPLRERAFDQLCARLKAPPAYIKGLPAKLQMACVNHGLQRSGNGDEKAATIRMAGGSARALVSDRYARLDDEAMIETMRGTLRAAGLLGEARVRATGVGLSTVLRITFPERDRIIQHPTRRGDVIESGLDLLNGEVGNRSLSIAPVTVRLICLNGARSTERGIMHRLRHVGDPERMREAFADALPVAIAGAEQVAAQMERAVERIVDDVLGEFEGLEAFGLRAHETESVARDLAADRQLVLPAESATWEPAMFGGPVTAFDVLNAVTHYAQTRPTDRRVELESASTAYLRRRVAA